MWHMEEGQLGGGRWQLHALLCPLNSIVAQASFAKTLLLA